LKLTNFFKTVFYAHQAAVGIFIDVKPLAEQTDTYLGPGGNRHYLFPRQLPAPATVTDHLPPGRNQQGQLRNK